MKYIDPSAKRHLMMMTTTMMTMMMKTMTMIVRLKHISEHHFGHRLLSTLKRRATTLQKHMSNIGKVMKH